MRKKVRVTAQLVDVKAVLLPVSQTAADKRLRRTRKNSDCCFYTCIYIQTRNTDLGLVASHWFSRKLHLSGFQDGVLLKDVLLGLIMAKRLQNDKRFNAALS